MCLCMYIVCVVFFVTSYTYIMIAKFVCIFIPIHLCNVSDLDKICGCSSDPGHRHFFPGKIYGSCNMSGKP